MVLLLPWILAMLGDNPMQSEFSSHIGLTGKCFCRVCHVKGADAKNRPQGDEGERERVADFLRASPSILIQFRLKLNILDIRFQSFVRRRTL